MSFVAFLPLSLDIGLIGGILVILLTDLFLPVERRVVAGYLSALLLAGLFVQSFALDVSGPAFGGAYVGDPAYNTLFENPGFGNHWLCVQLVGTDSNRSGIGARIHAVITENGKTRSVYRHVNSGGSFGANPLRQTIGMGTASKIDLLEIHWPRTGKTQTFQDVTPDRMVRITEGSDEIETVTAKKTTIGG